KYTVIWGYSNTKPQANDCWMVEMKEPSKRVDPTDEMQAVPFDLLSQNGPLRVQLQRHRPDSDKPGKIMFADAGARSAAAMDSVCIGEYAAQDLHTMAELHELIGKCPKGSEVHIVFVPASEVETAMRKAAEESD